MESARLIAGLARVVRDVAAAEELAQDALVAALEQWPREGVPRNPGAWLMATAKHRALDLLRHRKMADRKHQDLVTAEAFEPDLRENLGDDLLPLIFIACHPILSREARVALTLRLLGGLTTPEIARAFLTPEPTIAQRIVRAKKTLTDANIPFELPPASERLARLDSVLEVIYLIFNEGYAATSGNDWLRPALCEEAQRLIRILAGLLPQEAEVHGLAALIELQASRLRARLGPDGEPILLLDQNRARWDHLLIQRGLTSLALAEQLAPERGPYTLQAALAACHARARTADQTDWRRIVALYVELGDLTPSPIIDLNRAVALGMAEGPAAGLALADTLLDQLASYHLLPAVRADLLVKLGRHAEARAEFLRAAELTANTREQTLLRQRAAALP